MQNQMSKTQRELVASVLEGFEMLREDAVRTRDGNHTSFLNAEKTRKLGVTSPGLTDFYHYAHYVQADAEVREWDGVLQSVRKANPDNLAELEAALVAAMVNVGGKVAALVSDTTQYDSFAMAGFVKQRQGSARVAKEVNATLWTVRSMRERYAA